MRDVTTLPIVDPLLRGGSRENSPGVKRERVFAFLDEASRALLARV